MKRVVVIVAASLLACIAVAGIATFAAARPAATDEAVMRQLGQAQVRLAALESRVAVLEEPRPAPKPVRDVAGLTPADVDAYLAWIRVPWRKLVRGMTREQIREALGEPEKIEGGELETWWYHYTADNRESYPASGMIVLFRDKLDSWLEPKL